MTADHEEIDRQIGLLSRPEQNKHSPQGEIKQKSPEKTRTCKKLWTTGAVSREIQ